jgi:hypothetical protein
MKGAIFIALNEMIEEQHGLGLWHKIIDKAGADGIFSSTETYTDQELFDIVAVVCEELEADLPTVLRLFGEYLFDFLHKSHPIFADSSINFFDFISSIDGVIHVEVHKLDELAQTPTINVQKVSSHEALLDYFSPRKLCHLAEGLLLGAAKHYGIKIKISQTQCMHQDAPSCHLNLTEVN